MRLFLALCVSVGIGIGVALASASAAAQTSDGHDFDARAAFQGSKSFRTYCSSCHGKTGRGDGPLAEHLKVPPANLTKLSESNGGEFPYNAVLETINFGKKVAGHGTTEMPAWADAFLATDTEEEAEKRKHELVQHLWSLNKWDPAADGTTLN